VKVYLKSACILLPSALHAGLLKKLCFFDPLSAIQRTVWSCSHNTGPVIITLVLCALAVHVYYHTICSYNIIILVCRLFMNVHKHRPFDVGEDQRVRCD
jgi:hypothetical protein